MAIGTVYLIPSSIEVFVWLAIFCTCAWFIQQYADGKFFLHGFLVSLLNCVWVTAAHIVLSKSYLANHPEEAMSYANLYKIYHLSMTSAMLLFGPVIGILSGIVLGMMSTVFALIKLRTKQ